jgi:hypothetical protein
MNDKSRRQFIAFCQFCLAGFTTAKFSAFLQQFWSCGAMDSAVNSALSPVVIN